MPQPEAYPAPSYKGSPQWMAPHLPHPTPQWQQQAHHNTTTSTPDMSQWLLDSGASHHIANNLNNLSLHTPYTGSENVMIGNGATLPITHTGSNLLPSHYRDLKLTTVLCVPSMHKNLISVNKLCKTNNVDVQLCPSDFQVKDLQTGTTLLTGKANSGVYEWLILSSSSSNSPLFFSTSKSSSLDWHSCLGHPNYQTLRHMISLFFFAFIFFIVV